MYFLILIYSLEGRENPINTYVMNIRFPVRIYNYKYRIVLNSYSLVLGDFEYSFSLTSRVIILDYTLLGIANYGFARLGRCVCWVTIMVLVRCRIRKTIFPLGFPVYL